LDAFTLGDRFDSWWMAAGGFGTPAGILRQLAKWHEHAYKHESLQQSPAHTHDHARRQH
jgi:hypothetical protein